MFPLSDAQADHAPAPVEVAGRPEEPGRVLIVDDNEINRRVLSSMLRKERYTLRAAADGEKALELARQDPPELILLDIMMPGKDGYQVCAELKTDPRTERVPVIFLSALAEVADKIRGLELGAVDYITKPFDQGEVLARVRSQLKIQRLASALLRANRDLEGKQARIEEDLKAAGAIQRSLVPSQPPPLDSLHMAWRFMPCGRVGGDLFNFCPLGERQIGVYMIDVSGHGVPAAMITVSLSQFLSVQTGHLLRPDGAPAAPAEVLRRLDAEYPMERFDKYFTVAYALIDHESGALRYSLAGHPKPVLLRRDGRVELLDEGGTIIGLGMGGGFDEGARRLARGDRLFLYTDGIVELEDATGMPFGETRFYSHLQRSRGVPLEDACDRVVEALAAFAGDVEAADDITLLAIEFAGDMRESARP